MVLKPIHTGQCHCGTVKFDSWFHETALLASIDESAHKTLQ
jgi:hypothetical protein